MAELLAPELVGSAPTSVVASRARAFGSLMPGGEAPAKVRFIFALFDFDESNTIHYDELVLLLSSALGGFVKERGRGRLPTDHDMERFADEILRALNWAVYLVPLLVVVVFLESRTSPRNGRNFDRSEGGRNSVVQYVESTIWKQESVCARALNR